MLWSDIISNPATIAALVALLTSLLAQIATASRMKREFMLESRAEAVALALLRHPKWALRSFDKIKARLGGFDDDELRRILVRAGAVRFRAMDGEEYWGLLRRNRRYLDGNNVPSRDSRNYSANDSRWSDPPPPPPPRA